MVSGVGQWFRIILFNYIIYKKVLQKKAQIICLFEERIIIINSNIKIVIIVTDITIIIITIIIINIIIILIIRVIIKNIKGKGLKIIFSSRQHKFNEKRRDHKKDEFR